MSQNNEIDFIPVTFADARSGATFESEIGPAVTGTEAIAGLIAEKFLPEPSGGRYALSLKTGGDGQMLDLSRPLREQGVAARSVVQVLLTGHGARG